MIDQWSARQVHDTVAAIVSQADFVSARRQSLIGRLLRYIGHWLDQLFQWSSGRVDPRVIVVAAIVLVAVIVVGRVIADRRFDSRSIGRGPVFGRGERRDYWKRAADLASTGRYTDASHALYAALLSDLATAGLIRFHSSKTSGDYARELRRSQPALASEFRDFARAFDQAVFGHDAVTAEEWRIISPMASRISESLRRRAAA